MPITNTAWAKGQSGNPGGRPRILEAVRDIARESTTLAIETLRTIAADQAAPHAARVSAATALLDRAWGKPAQWFNQEETKSVPRHLPTGDQFPQSTRPTI